MNKLGKALFVVFLFGLFLINQHIMDISNNKNEIYRVSLNNELLCDVEYQATGTTNGFWNNNRELYHIAWYANYAIIIIYTIFCLRCIVK